ncbi:Acyl carrier protein [Curvibacter sp. AEP1-3]|uniref:phosphopantetheine-binding protein n=1 Tax=Curvibacter sp. AEP1-3 TaxID=1844971 RepID=UPI000B3CDE74|nr:phosphopantetheine-binding protein [Curvibacter sp. AEP1-3]ARV19183.1 Acyl carrier protein [Curvibacter sp. AEP1-3]
MTTFEKILADVKEVILDTIDVAPEKIIPTASLRDDLDADSLDSIEIVMALEDKFAVVFLQEVTEKLVTVNDLVCHIETMVIDAAASVV